MGAIEGVGGHNCTCGRMVGYTLHYTINFSVIILSKMDFFNKNLMDKINGYL